MTINLPIAVIGAGPVGMAAAAQLVKRGLQPIVFEKGTSVASAMESWAHVRVFSPWEYNIDPSARALLEEGGWDAPELTDLPTGREIIDRYLAPLAALPSLAPHIRYGASVEKITRKGIDKVSNAGRDDAPFVISWVDEEGNEQRSEASAVIDASGTWTKPNPMGIDGLPVPGENKNSDRIVYGIPDVLGAERQTYAGKRVLIVGSGHSAINAALALLSLQEEQPGTKVLWALRRNRLEKLLGGGINDQLPERGALGLAAKRAIDEGRLQLLAPFAATRIAREGEALNVSAELSGMPMNFEVDRIIVATGFRPDLAMLSELRIAIDAATEAPPALSPLIDPNFHSCGDVPAHGVVELTQPEKGFYIVGAKSYGRAPTFLMATGFEQVRSIAAELAGDLVAAREVHLVLPQTGVCSTSSVLGESFGGCCGAPVQAASSCCGGPAVETSSCCAADENAKAAGESGCGCGSNTAVSTTAKSEPVPA